MACKIADQIIEVTPQGLTISTRCLDLIMVEGQDLMCMSTRLIRRKT